MTKEILKQKFVEQCKPIIVINVNYYDVDDLITNLKSYELDAVKKARLGKWEHYRLAVYLTHLCNEDVIPEGNYLIRVSY